jgi:L-methionine (R)-S-oxide reductase
MTAEERAARYARILGQLDGLVSGKSPTLTAAMATICAVLQAKMPHHSWTGFYLVKSEDELHVGPYQGRVACQILRGGGVCLTCARNREAVIVPDVARFPGHIPCDPRTRSEIAIPILKGSDVVGVLDIDSGEVAEFTTDDVGPLSAIVALLGPFL